MTWKRQEKEGGRDFYQSSRCECNDKDNHILAVDHSSLYHVKSTSNIISKISLYEKTTLNGHDKEEKVKKKSSINLPGISLRRRQNA